MTARCSWVLPPPPLGEGWGGGSSLCNRCCWFERVGRVSPRRATHFLLLRQKKVSKEKATRSLGPLRCAAGQPAVLGVSGVWRNSLRSDMRQPLSAASCAPRPSPTGLAVQRAFAALGLQRQRALRAALGRREFASNLIAACAHSTCAKCQFHSKNAKSPHPNPLPEGEGVIHGPSEAKARWLPNPLRLGRGAQGAAGCRDSGRRGLSERSEFRSRLLAPSTAGCPKRSAGTQTSGRLSFGYFSLAKQRRSASPAGARPGLRPQQGALP